MKLSPLPPGLRGTSPVSLIATWFGSGLLPGAPGTWGSLGALPFAWGIVWLAGPLGLLGAVAMVFSIGIWAAGRYTRASGLKDCQNVVVDEVAGQWLVLLFVPLDVVAYFAAFLLFRAFDIFKPWPANAADREVSGGFGIMLDDIIAGAYALFLMHLGLYVIN
jgi:phosphatidylglycerophosphatase A